MNTPTPRTDAATYPADCLGQTLVTNRDCPCALERELTALTAERDQLRAALALGQQNCDDAYDDLRDERDAARAEVERLKTCGITELAAINPSVLEYCKHWEARAERAEAELATEREKLDWVFQNCKVEANDYTTGNRDVYYVHDREDLGVAMKEDAK